MEEESFIKKILYGFINIILAITSFIKRLFGIKPKEGTKNQKVEINTTTNNNDKQTKVTTDPATLPDTNHVNATDHSSNEDNADNVDNNDVILKLTNDNLTKLKTKENDLILFTDEEIDELIDKFLEEEYKEEKLKVKDASKVIKEKIKELKEKVVPIIKENIIKKAITTKEDLKKEIETVVKEELKEKPLMPKIKDVKVERAEKKDVYFIATPIKKELNLKESKPQPVKQTAKIITEEEQVIKEKITEKPFFMVQNTPEIPKPSVKEEVKNAAVVGGMLAANAVLDLVSPTPKAEPKKEELNLDSAKPPVVTEDTIIEKDVELPKLKEEKQPEQPSEETKPELVSEPETKMPEVSIPELSSIEPTPDLEPVPIVEEVQIEVTPTPTIEDKTNEEPKQEEQEPEPSKKEETKEEKKDTKKDEDKKIVSVDKIEGEILTLTLGVASIISGSKKETEKKELEDKNYDSYEEQIDKMLDSIETTLIKYEGKMTAKQKAKLKKEQSTLRNAKENLKNQKQADITHEERELDATIKEIELNGLQEELRRMHLENQIEMNESLLNNINGLENLTREQIANIDKQMLFKRLNKASMLLEMTSILALPFVRNKYFFYFTIGLIIDNHFNFINAFFRRKMNRYEPADLEQIKQGEDALNSALNVTFQNQVQLEYIISEALAKYPELANDPRFTNKVTKLRFQLENSYNKMMGKKNIMEKYHRKTKSQIKVLNRNEQSNAA